MYGRMPVAQIRASIEAHYGPKYGAGTPTPQPPAAARPIPKKSSKAPR